MLVGEEALAKGIESTRSHEQPFRENGSGTGRFEEKIYSVW